MAHFVTHLRFAGLENAKTQEILNELLQPLTAGAHIVKNFTLAIVQRPELLALQQFDIAIENGKRSLQIMSRRAQGVCGAQKPLTKLGVLLQQLMVGQRVCRLRLATGGVLPIRCARPDVARDTGIVLSWSQVGIPWTGSA